MDRSWIVVVVVVVEFMAKIDSQWQSKESCPLGQMGAERKREEKSFELPSELLESPVVVVVVGCCCCCLH